MADVSLGVGMYIKDRQSTSCAHLMLKTIICISCVSQLTERLLPLLSTSSTLQESTSIVLKGSSASSLRGASKFLVKKVDEYALLSKDKGGGGPGGGGGGDNKESRHGGPPSGGPGGGGDGKHFICARIGYCIFYPISYF